MATSSISRRRFLAGAAAAAGAALSPSWSGRAAAAAGPRIRRGSDRVLLGKTGIRTSVLGLGTGTHGGREQRDLGTKQFARLVRHALDCGLRYIDTADRYMTHVFVQIALADVKGAVRDELFIQTKTPATDPAVAKADVERFRRELRVDKIDSLLLHAQRAADWPQKLRPVMDALYEEKEKGRVRAVGVSCHGFEPLAAAADCDWCDTHLVRINPFGVKMDDAPEKVAAQIQKMHAQGRGVLGMKVYGEDGLGSREKRLESLKYVLGLGTVHAFTIGFTSTQQIDETLELIELATA